MVDAQIKNINLEVIKGICTQKGKLFLTQEEAAKVIGMSHTTLIKAQNQSGIIGMKVPGTKSYQHTPATLMELIEYFQRPTY